VALSSRKNQFVLSSFFDTFADSKRLNIVRSVHFNIFLRLLACCRPCRAVLRPSFRHESGSSPRLRRGQWVAGSNRNKLGTPCSPAMISPSRGANGVPNWQKSRFWSAFWG
jgi:hypothetical protein